MVQQGFKQSKQIASLLQKGYFIIQIHYQCCQVALLKLIIHITEGNEFSLQRTTAERSGKDEVWASMPTDLIT